MGWAFDDKRIVPFFGSESDRDTMKDLVAHCLKVLDEGTSVRQMVLETWLTVDYSLRQFLLSGFELGRFSDDDFDLGYSLLPSGFEGCLRLLRKAVKHNESLPLDLPKVDRAGGFRASAEFWRFVNDRYPQLTSQIEAARRDFVIEQNPDVAGHVANGGGYFTREPEVAARMNAEWCAVADGLDEDWFKRARRLNGARNVATHSFRAEEVARKLGFCGPHLVSATREECLSLLETLLAVSRCPRDE